MAKISLGTRKVTARGGRAVGFYVPQEWAREFGDQVVSGVWVKAGLFDKSVSYRTTEADGWVKRKATITPDGRILLTIPRAAADRLGVVAKDDIEVTCKPDGSLIVRPV